MPTYIDIHDISGATAEDVARAHAADLRIQDQHGVNYFKYWVNEKTGKAFCMCTAPNSEAADAVHRAAHGMTAARIMEITPDMADAFMGAAEVNGSALGASNPTAVNRALFSTLQISTGALDSTGTSFTTNFQHA